MPEPAVTGFFAGKYSTAIAGFIGSMISLRYIKNLTFLQALIAIAAGFALSQYGTPFVMYYSELPPSLRDPTAFVVGLCAMNLIPGILKLSGKMDVTQLKR